MVLCSRMFCRVTGGGGRQGSGCGLTLAPRGKRNDDFPMSRFGGYSVCQGRRPGKIHPEDRASNLASDRSALSLPERGPAAWNTTTSQATRDITPTIGMTKRLAVGPSMTCTSFESFAAVLTLVCPSVPTISTSRRTGGWYICQLVRSWRGTVTREPTDEPISAVKLFCPYQAKSFYFYSERYLITLSLTRMKSTDVEGLSWQYRAIRAGISAIVGANTRDGRRTRMLQLACTSQPGRDNRDNRGGRHRLRSQHRDERE